MCVYQFGKISFRIFAIARLIINSKIQKDLAHWKPIIIMQDVTNHHTNYQRIFAWETIMTNP